MKIEEEKAKAYDEAIKKAESLYKIAEPMSGCNVIIETLFPELVESEGEKVRKKIINLIKMSNEVGGFALHKWEADEMLAWLEKQGEHANFRNKIQVGDRVTRNEDGVLVNLSQLKRVAKPSENHVDKVEQKPAWSEDDKNFMYDTLSNLTELKDRYGEGYGNVGKCIAWLKSLRPQNRWKPSDEQMKAFEHFVRSNGESGYASPYDYNTKLLYSLLEQLKKLKEEQV